jgi:hypothetical protein
MAHPFTCSHCGITTTKRSHFWWVLAVVGFFNGHIWVDGDEGSICTRCTPNWASMLGRVIYLLMAICILLLLWQFTHKTEKDAMPNVLGKTDAYRVLVVAGK